MYLLADISCISVLNFFVYMTWTGDKKETVFYMTARM